MKKQYLYIETDDLPWISPVFEGDDTYCLPRTKKGRKLKWNTIEDLFQKGNRYPDYQATIIYVWDKLTGDLSVEDYPKIEKVDYAHLPEADTLVYLAGPHKNHNRIELDYLLDAGVFLMNHTFYGELTRKIRSHSLDEKEKRMYSMFEDIKSVLHEHLRQCSEVFQEAIEWDTLETLEDLQLDENNNLDLGRWGRGRQVAIPGPIICGCLRTYYNEQVTSSTGGTGDLYIPTRFRNEWYRLRYEFGQ